MTKVSVSATDAFQDCKIGRIVNQSQRASIVFDETVTKLADARVRDNHQAKQPGVSHLLQFRNANNQQDGMPQITVNRVLLQDDPCRQLAAGTRALRKSGVCQTWKLLPALLLIDKELLKQLLSANA